MTLKYTIGQQPVQLLAHKCLFFSEERMLVVADLHLGKIGHFRQAGMALPAGAHETDLANLSAAIQQTGAQQICFLGDLFHSKINSDWHLFEQWLGTHPELQCTLVVGNHDQQALHALPKRLSAVNSLTVGKCLLTHEPTETEDFYNICGHLHPAVRLHGKGRQQLTLPCFFFGEKRGVLPAFGAFTGYVALRPRAGDAVFAVAENRVWPVGAQLA